MVKRVAVVVGALLLAGTASFALVHRLEEPRRQVAIPGDDATPEQVITALVDAWDAHDDHAVEALTDPRYLQHYADRSIGLEPYDHVRLVAILGHVPYGPSGEGGLSPGEQSTEYGTSLDIQGSGGGQADGQNPLSFTLVKTGPQGAWRVFSTGLG